MVIYGKGNDKYILRKKQKKKKEKVTLSGLNEIETKNRQHYKGKSSNFISAL